MTKPLEMYQSLFYPGNLPFFIYIYNVNVPEFVSQSDPLYGISSQTDGCHFGLLSVSQLCAGVHTSHNIYVYDYISGKVIINTRH